MSFTGFTIEITIAIYSSWSSEQPAMFLDVIIHWPECCDIALGSHLEVFHQPAAKLPQRHDCLDDKVLGLWGDFQGFPVPYRKIETWPWILGDPMKATWIEPNKCGSVHSVHSVHYLKMSPTAEKQTPNRIGILPQQHEDHLSTMNFTIESIGI